MIPQIIIIALQFLRLLLAAHDHGKPRGGDHNFWVVLLSTGIGTTLLILGGFYDGFMGG